MSARGGVLAVVATDVTGEPAGTSLEMLSAARLLAEGLGCDLCVVVVAEGGTPTSGLLSGCGARRIYEVGLESSAARPDDKVLEAAWLAVQSADPGAVFFADSQAARVTAARLAARMECELVSGCTFLRVREGRVQMGRPCLSGRAFAQLVWNPAHPVVVTVAAGAFSSLPPNGDTAELIALELQNTVPTPGVEIVSESVPTPEAMAVGDADVVVAGGAGVGGAEGFGLLFELARRLGGTVAASRVAVDRGWIPSARQVGLTGKSVSPRVYLAFGISGAPQHVAGIRSAGKVVAINRDPNAPIFRVADLAVVADLDEVVPALLDRLPSKSAEPGEGLN